MKLTNVRIAYVFDLPIQSDSRAQKEIAELIRNGASVIVCAWDKEGICKKTDELVNIRGIEVKVHNIRLTAHRSKGIKENLGILLKYELTLMMWLIRERKNYDYIHCCNMDTAYGVSVISKLMRKQFVYDVFDDYADAHNCSGKLYDMIKRIDSRIMKKAYATIICSEQRTEQILRRPKRLVVIHNSPDILNVDATLFPIDSSDKLKIAYVGALVPDRFLLEITKVVAENPRFEFYCGGIGVLQDDIKKMADEYSNIHYLGRLPYEKVLALETQCDVIPAMYSPEVPNHKYAAPNKFYEALYLGKPTIMFHSTGMDKEVEKYGSGITINMNKDELEQALHGIYESRVEWREKNSYLKHIFQAYYSWQVMGERLTDIYRKCGE